MNLEEKSAGQKNAELILEKLHLIRKLKFRIFNSMAVIFYLSFHIFQKFKNDFVAKSFNIKQVLNKKK